MLENDYELVFLAQHRNEEAIYMLYNKYKPIIVKKSQYAINYADHHGIDINDIMQEAFIGLDEAIKNFSQDNKASFYTFASVCINRQILNYIKKVNREKDKTLNDAVTIDDSLERVISDGTDIESSLLGEDYANALTNNIRKLLTNFEKNVFDLKIKNYSFSEIAKLLNKDVKSIYNTFQRIKYKIKKNIKIDNS